MYQSVGVMSVHTYITLFQTRICMHKYLISFCLAKKVKLSNSLNAAHRLTDEVVKLNSPNKRNGPRYKRKREKVAANY